MGLTRVQKTRAATLSHTFYVDETATASSTAVTVDITDAAGAVVVDDGATSNPGTGQYTYALTGQSQLKYLTVVWSATIGGVAITETDYVEVVGGFFFTLVEGRASDASLSSTSKYTTEELAVARLEVEVECEEICARAFVPRYRRVTLDGTGTSDLILSDADIRAVRSAKVAPAVDETFVALSAGELAALAIRPLNVLRRTDGNVWTEGERNVVLEYEYGLDAPPADLKRASLTRFRTRLNIPHTGVPDRASAFTVEGGGTYRIDQAGKYKVGIPDVDAVYARYSLRDTDESSAGAGGTGVAASRTLDYDPQHYSLFHQGIR